MKQWPTLTSDIEAEAFVAEADLTEYDPAALTPMTFHRRNRSVMIPPDLETVLQETAVKAGVTVDEFVQDTLRRALTAA